MESTSESNSVIEFYKNWFFFADGAKSVVPFEDKICLYFSYFTNKKCLREWIKVKIAKNNRVVILLPHRAFVILATEAQQRLNNGKIRTLTIVLKVEIVEKLIWTFSDETTTVDRHLQGIISQILSENFEPKLSEFRNSSWTFRTFAARNTSGRWLDFIQILVTEKNQFQRFIST